MAVNEWKPTEDERRLMREALVKDKLELAEDETALLVAEEWVVNWVRRAERERTQGTPCHRAGSQLPTPAN